MFLRAATCIGRILVPFLALCQQAALRCDLPPPSNANLVGIAKHSIDYLN